MAQGTIAVTNGSVAVVGSGTAFTGTAPGSFITLTVGSVPYTVAVASVQSATALTLVSKFDGPTASGLAYDITSPQTMALATMGVTVQAQKALRMMLADEANWRSIYSSSSSVTVTTPEGGTFTGPSWGYMSEQLGLKAKKGANDDITSLSGLTTPLSVAQGGTGGSTQESACSGIGTMFVKLPVSTSYGSALMRTSVGYFDTDRSPYPGGGGAPFSYAEIMTIAEFGESPNYSQIAVSVLDEAAPRFRQRFNNPPRLTDWRDFLVNGLNAIPDTNGFYKTSSPIIKIFRDGTAELNSESEGATVIRVDMGVYKVLGVLGFNSSPEWGGAGGGFSVPQNGNGLPLLWVDYDVEPNGDIVLRTFHREHANVPAFARNHIEGLKDGDPVDIPAGRWVDLRVEMPE